ncbi:protein EPIDERMAL PATTERNING FACTOR 2 isoform X1 [Quercus robur]|uniref:Epidermal patterning factor-like protein n=1 Tax=Quercus lobata TaxID=97700 RepID=A0A7N2KVH9_QUELO|nr:protein EPIDERMAL PATTERNING FACTOR 2 isoform X1 [Quercus lobata]XP_050261881.1 protein EPIDERMAL PATTERNING FACTOR 2 isoform X1 [Quercus robur]
MRNLYLGAHTFVLLLIFFMVLASSRSLRVTHRYISVSLHDKGTNVGEGHVSPKEEAKEELGTELYPTGSSLPDCSHACGPCFPCKRVMVSFKCFTESCPIVYRCMCKGKYYHVPSN